MQLNGYPDLLSYSRQSRATVQIRERLDKASLEAVTGLQSDLTQATNGEVGRAHLLGKALNDVDHGLQINALSTVRMSMISGAVSGARESINGLGPRASIALASENEVHMRLLSDEAAGTLKSVMSAFSAAQGPRNLFSGTKTDTATYAAPEVLLEDIKNIMANATSLADADTQISNYFDSPTGGFETRIYQGSQGSGPGVPIGNGNTLSQDLKGNNQTIKDTLRGLAVMANTFEMKGTISESELGDIYANAASFVTTGSNGLVTKEGSLGLISETLGKTKARFDSERSTLTNAYNDMFGRDQFEAAAELQSLQIQLEASYTLTSRLSSLSLSNFLR